MWSCLSRNMCGKMVSNITYSTCPQCRLAVRKPAPQRLYLHFTEDLDMVRSQSAQVTSLKNKLSDNETTINSLMNKVSKIHEKHNDEVSKLKAEISA